MLQWPCDSFNFNDQVNPTFRHPIYFLVTVLFWTRSGHCQLVTHVLNLSNSNYLWPENKKNLKVSCIGFHCPERSISFIGIPWRINTNRQLQVLWTARRSQWCSQWSTPCSRCSRHHLLGCRHGNVKLGVSKLHSDFSWLANTVQNSISPRAVLLCSTGLGMHDSVSKLKSFKCRCILSS